MIRSIPYVPASSERFVAKARERGADAIIFALEDSVAPGEKERSDIKQCIFTLRRGDRPRDWFDRCL